MGRYIRKKKKFTSYQKAATQRNWCIYVLNGMIGLCAVFHRFGVDQEKVERLAKTLNSFRYTIDWTWEKHKLTLREEAEAAEAGKAPPEVAKVVELSKRRRA